MTKSAKAAAAEQKMIACLRTICTAQLIEMAEQLNTDFSAAECGIVLEYVLIEIEGRMTESEYVEFMGRLEAVI